MKARGFEDRELWWAAVSVLVIGGLCLRIFASQGGLWTDEAWSVVYAEQAQDALGVFLRINHDNNHHLISLWLQLVGPSATPLIARLPAIIAGAASVLVAALLLRTISPLAGLLAGMFFAVSPIMVTYGSEARGYAPMSLAALALLLLVLRAARGDSAARDRWLIGCLSLLGTLSQMTMLAPVMLTGGWLYLHFRSAAGAREGFVRTWQIMGPAVIAAAFVPIFVICAAAMSPSGMRVGGYVPFSEADLVHALNDLSAWTFGLGFLAPPLALAGAAVVSVVLVMRPPKWLDNRSQLYAILIAGAPLVAAILRPPNVSFARYFLLSAIALILVASECLAHGLKAGGWYRRAAMATISMLVVGCLWQDWSVIRLQRGHSETIIAEMRARSPDHGRVYLETPRLEAVASVAAARAGYHLEFARDCSPVDFLVSSEPARLSTPGAIDHCGRSMRPIGSGRRSALSGDDWILYAQKT